MVNSIQISLCKGLRACGIPKAEAHEILDIVSKWYDQSGVEWCNQRIKDLRQWYESYLGGNLDPPDWFRRTKEGLPTGIWNWVFHLPIAKALAVLSLNTAFYETELSETQEEKFLKGLAGNQHLDREFVSSLEPISNVLTDNYGVHLPKKMPDMTPVSINDVEKSTPIDNSTRTVTPHTDGEKLLALEESWVSVPQVTFDFLESHDRWDILPMSVVGNAYQVELDRPHSSNVGRIGVIQEPQLKARIVANPNRVLQHTLEPLQTLLGGITHQLVSSCIFDQESGMRWVQDQLRHGYSISGSDLTSASDLLDLELSESLVSKVFNLDKVEDYDMYRDYFLKVSRSNWYFPQKRGGPTTVHWSQGDPLGTGPSIFYLDLTNNAAAIIAYELLLRDGKRVPDYNLPDPTGLFRTIGDDIVMRSELLPYYERVITSLGGEINHSKTLQSDTVAEFAGRVITTKAVYLKKVNYREPSDNSFMSYMSELGQQAKWFLRPRQRRAYEHFQFVPGVVVAGPWNQDSFGEALATRYQWYLEEVLPAFSREEPDPAPVTVGAQLLRADLENQEKGRTRGRDVYSGLIDHVLPLLEPEDYQSSVATKHPAHGDPRLTKGKTTLEVLEGNLDIVKPYPQWKRESTSQETLNGSFEATTSTCKTGTGPTSEESTGEQTPVPEAHQTSEVAQQAPPPRRRRRGR